MEENENSKKPGARKAREHHEFTVGAVSQSCAFPVKSGAGIGRERRGCLLSVAPLVTPSGGAGG